MGLSLKQVRQILGVLWIIVGLLQLQPQMFIMNMFNKLHNILCLTQRNLETLAGRCCRGVAGRWGKSGENPALSRNGKTASG